MTNLAIKTRVVEQLPSRRWSYAMALCVVATIIVGADVIEREILMEHECGAAHTALVSRQCAYAQAIAQRIHRYFAALSSPEQAGAIDDIRRYLDASDLIQRDLLHGNELTDLAPFTHDDALQAMTQLQCHRQAIRTTLALISERVEAGGDVRPLAGQLQAQATEYAEQSAVLANELLMDIMQDHGQDGSEWLHWFTVSGVVLLLLTTVILLFEPTVRTVETQSAELFDHKRQLERLAMVVSRADSGVVICDRDGQVEWCNEAFMRTTGFALQDIQGRKPGRVLQGPATDRASIDRMRQAIASGEPFQEEVLNYRKNGEEYWVSIDCSPLRNEAGELTGFVAIHRDVSERRQRNAEIDRQRQLFERVVHSVPDSLIIASTDRRILLMNRAAEREFGYSLSEVIGQKTSILYAHRDDYRRMGAFFSLDRPTNEPVLILYRRKDGSTFPGETAPSTLRDAAGTAVGFVGVIRDITERQEAEAQRRRLQRVLQIAVDTMPQRVFWKDREGRFLGCNQRFARDAGFRDVNEIIGKLDSAMPWREQASTYRQNDLDVMTSGQPRLNIEQSYPNPDGTVRWIRSSKIPLRDDQDQIIGVMGVFEDVTSEREAQDELRRARDAAEAANMAKSEFLANMSHEIRTPMTAILGFAELLAENPDLSASPESRLETINTIRLNGEHLLSIINDILDLSKIEAGRMTMERIDISPLAILDDVLSILEIRAKSRGIEVGRRLDTPIPETINSDPVRLRQILMNVIGNAIKFTDVGRVTVAISFDADDADGPFLRFEVTDTGIGMTAEQMAALFSPFSQGDSSVTRRYGGTGLGLTISKRLAQMLGGTITMKSEIGVGSQFTVSIRTEPREQLRLITPNERSSSAAFVPLRDLTAGPELRPLDECRILLAEDGIDNQRLISYILRKAGADVVVVDNGLRAIEAWMADRDARPYDLVLMDMQMPEMDGYTAARHLRAAEYRGPIVALTAHAMSGDRAKCIASGCDEYASKPIVRKQLLHLITRLIRSRRTSVATPAGQA